MRFVVRHFPPESGVTSFFLFVVRHQLSCNVVRHRFLGSWCDIYSGNAVRHPSLWIVVRHLFLIVVRHLRLFNAVRHFHSRITVRHHLSLTRCDIVPADGSATSSSLRQAIIFLPRFLLTSPRHPGIFVRLQPKKGAVFGLQGNLFDLCIVVSGPYGVE